MPTLPLTKSDELTVTVHACGTREPATEIVTAPSCAVSEPPVPVPRAASAGELTPRPGVVVVVVVVVVLAVEVVVVLGVVVVLDVVVAGSVVVVVVAAAVVDVVVGAVVVVVVVGQLFSTSHVRSARAGENQPDKTAIDAATEPTNTARTASLSANWTPERRAIHKTT